MLNCIAVVYATASFCPPPRRRPRNKSPFSKCASYSNDMSGRRQWSKMSACRQLNMFPSDAFLNRKIGLEPPDEMLFHVKQVSVERERHSNARAVRIVTCFNDRLMRTFTEGESDA